MMKKEQLYSRRTGDKVYPITHSDAVLMPDGETILTNALGSGGYIIDIRYKVTAIPLGNEMVIEHTTDTINVETIITNFSDELTDSSKYRICLLRWKQRNSSYWSVPMFAFNSDGTPKHPLSPNRLAYEDTWWAVTGARNKWWGGIKDFKTIVQTETIPFPRILRARFKFGLSKERKFVGCALFKFDAQTTKWVRVSNISSLELYATYSSSDTNIGNSGFIIKNKQ